jgi:putative CocE/NonD family hydrolase
MKKVLLIFSLPVALAVAHLAGVIWFGGAPAAEIFKEENVAVPMRDGVVLRADIWRPAGEGKFPVLVYRTPYDRRRTSDSRATFSKAVERGYAVVIQDVRGRYASGGEFNPYFQEGHDGYDTIEWAAKQAWSNGSVGTFGLSYPGAVQWLAAIENPPHLKAMVPAMTFSTPRNFIYSGGVFDGSWVGWIWDNIAPDVRVRKNLPGPRNGREARQVREEALPKIQRALPLAAMTELREVAPWYYEWLKHPPNDAYWEPLELRGKSHLVSDQIAILNFSGWYDEAYGPEGATTNFYAFQMKRKALDDPRIRLIVGPWPHGIPGPDASKAGEREFGPAAVIDYDEMVLRWLDHYVRGIDNGVEREPRVRAFVMGANRWREGDRWPLDETKSTLFLTAPKSPSGLGGLAWKKPQVRGSQSSSFVSDPSSPVTDPYPAYSGGHDYASFAKRKGVLVYETQPLENDVEVVGNIEAVIFLSCDAPDTDLWVKLLDVEPDGKAVNLMSPGLDVLRASYRDPERRQLLEPGKVYELRLKNLMTGNLFAKGHRIRVQISAEFFPHFSRNLHTGKLETSESSEMRTATVRIHHDGRYPSRIVLPVIAR